VGRQRVGGLLEPSANPVLECGHALLERGAVFREARRLGLVGQRPLLFELGARRRASISIDVRKEAA
jgi:hypothetical protein